MAAIAHPAGNGSGALPVASGNHQLAETPRDNSAPALPPVNSMASHIAMPAVTNETEQMVSTIRTQIEQDAAGAANILRAWIKDGGGTESQ